MCQGEKNCDRDTYKHYIYIGLCYCIKAEKKIKLIAPK